MTAPYSRIVEFADGIENKTLTPADIPPHDRSAVQELLLARWAKRKLARGQRPGRQPGEQQPAPRDDSHEPSS
jgi:hypothetical protein